MCFTRIKITYEQFETDSLLEESMDVNLNSIANITGESLNDSGQSAFNFGTSDGQNPSFLIDGSDDEDFVIEMLETEQIHNPIDDDNGASSNVIPHKIESVTIITRGKSDKHNFDNG